jgi:spore coat protein CotH
MLEFHKRSMILIRIQTIEINFTQTNWDYMLDTATAGYESDIMANWVKINGVQYDSVGVRYKGNSTYNANQVKNPFHITLDAFKNQDYQGYTDIKLSNVAKDPSFVREVFLTKYYENTCMHLYQIMQMFM